MSGLMMDVPMLLSGLIDYAAEYHGDTEIVGRKIDDSIHRYTYREAQGRIKRLARSLKRLGVKQGDHVGSIAWSTHRHFELFYAVPGIGAALHTTNPRLFSEQIIYIINHAEDSVLFMDRATLEVIEPVASKLKTVKHFVLMTERSKMPETSLPNLLCYEDLLEQEDDEFDWPVLNERSVSCICYTSGTTGNPKGVVYSHRANVLQTMFVAAGFNMPRTKNGGLEVLMPNAPMFHGNAWNMPFIAAYTGSKLVLPGRNLSPEKIYQLMEVEGVTVSVGVPTIWLTLVAWMEKHNKHFSSLRQIISSGTAPPESLVKKLVENFNVDFTQSYGMTEAMYATICTMSPGGNEQTQAEQIGFRMRSGRAAYGVQMRIVDEQEVELPKNGVSVGHLRLRGPWVSNSYLKGEGGNPLDAEGWLKTGDMAVIDQRGQVKIVDRHKDVIKSGGEWISSIQLEDAAMSHPEVKQAAAIGIYHPKWQERPMLIVVCLEGSQLAESELMDHLRERLANWCLPDMIKFSDELPLSGTGKIDKALLRSQFKEYVLPKM